MRGIIKIIGVLAITIGFAGLAASGLQLSSNFSNWQPSAVLFGASLGDILFAGIVLLLVEIAERLEKSPR